MSNAKWRKVLSAISATRTNVTRCEFKCIDSDYITKVRSPQSHDIEHVRFTDGPFQPFEYKWVEWFRFPRRYKPYPNVGYLIEQDVEALHDEIKAAADAMLTLDEEYLWLFGYTGRAG
ncbi:MAG: DUF6678 family protein [Planctomycetota bacterium]